MWKSSLMIMLSMALKINLHFCSCTSPLHSCDTELLRDKAARQQRKFSIGKCTVTGRGQEHTAWTQHPPPCLLSLLGEHIQKAPPKSSSQHHLGGGRSRNGNETVQCRSWTESVSVKTRHISGMWLLSEEKLHRLKIISITKRWSRAEL